MIALILFGYVTVLASVVPWTLTGAPWTSRAPRLAILVWLAAVSSAIMTALLAGVVVLVPLHTVGDAMAALIRVCDSLAPPAMPRLSSPPHLAGLVWIVVVLTRLGYGCAVVVPPRRREQRNHRRSTRILGRRHPDLDVLVLDHPSPQAFSLSGAGGQIVITAGAVRSLTPAELRAVIAHERAHLRGRHHLAIAVAAVLARAFPHPRLFPAAEAELRRLVEFAADDQAARRAAPAAVAQAMLALAAPPPAALGMTGAATTERIRRQLDPRDGLSRLAITVRLLLVVGLLLLPLAAPAATELARIGWHCSLAT
jgi:Zn-dependent protease with chaperone function